MQHIVLDFDGVINALHNGQLYDWDHYETFQLEYCAVKISSDVISWLNELHDNPHVEVLWLSSWLEETQLFARCGIPHFDYIDTVDTLDNPRWKTDSLLRFIAHRINDNDTIVWVDDEEDKNVVEQTIPHNVQCFTPDSNRGITPKMINIINQIIDHSSR